jgi:hypothetical protein
MFTLVPIFCHCCDYHVKINLSGVFCNCPSRPFCSEISSHYKVICTGQRNVIRQQTSAKPLRILASAAGLRPALILVPAGGNLASLGSYTRLTHVPYPVRLGIYK